MGFLKFQDYRFEGEKSNLQKIYKYFTEQFTNSTGIQWGEENGNDIFFDNLGDSEVLSCHIMSRNYYVQDFKEISSQNDVVFYYSCGSEMGGLDTNDYDEKYFKWKPKNLAGYGFKVFSIVQVLKDGTERKWTDDSRKFWTLQSVKDCIRHLEGDVYFCLSEGYEDLRHDELNELIKKEHTSIFEIYSAMDDILSWCEDNYPDWFAVTNDKEGRYFTPDMPVIYDESCEIKKATSLSENQSNEPQVYDDDEIPF